MHKISKATLFFALVLYASLHAVYCKHVVITAPQHVLIGSTVNVSATLYDGRNIANKGTYSFSWKDNSGHTKEIETSEPFSNWTFNYANDKINLGEHRLEVGVSEEKFIVWFPVAESTATISVINTLSGSLELIQNDKVRTKDFVSTQDVVKHKIELWQADLDFLISNHYYINTYWFRNCTYLGMSHVFEFEDTYSVPDQYYNIEALVVASPDPLPEPTTSTTTTTTTTTTSTTTTTTPATTTTTTISTSTSTTPATTSTTTTSTTSTTTTPATTSTTPATTTKPSRSKRDVNQTMHANAKLLGLNLAAAVKQELQKQNLTGATSVALLNPLGVRKLKLLPVAAPPHTCIDGKVVAQDSSKMYGYFHRQVISKTPISGFSTSGKNWVQHWELINLQITCKGSPPYEVCTQYYNAPYNATGNETCSSYDSFDKCDFNFARYFADSKTILFFIRNEVSATLNQVTVNIYEAKRQSQLSVVVVPIACTLVAVCLVIFGVAYYMQSRNRFTVEVADFNFGDTQSVDMEYKTFQQRLIDSIRDAWPWPRWRRYSQSSTDLMAEQPSNPGSFGGNVGDVDSNLRYNTFN
ncbi:hypothetical protein AWZ03_003062 [Drosophila navojoa]|uniref:Uncharacterized protein n=1 Tax=Drosophila navojoa TaxID=7232 RepID=A0A484BNX7_DRONA|nr:putative GPI-anchored protein pfl2 [Drosophila navojoa]TDG50473.1 hypothetical protein AWZ03_003062 [Drosophila navojoa]